MCRMVVSRVFTFFRTETKEELCTSKTAEDIDKDHTKAQFKEFSNYVMPGDKGQDCPFYIAIPKGSEETLKKVLGDLGLLDKSHVKWQSF